jgi:hypothetical protein
LTANHDQGEGAISSYLRAPKVHTAVNHPARKKPKPAIVSLPTAVCQREEKKELKTTKKKEKIK